LAKEVVNRGGNPLDYGRHGHRERRAVIVIAYVLVSIGVIIAFLLATFVIGWFVNRLSERLQVRRPGRIARGSHPPVKARTTKTKPLKAGSEERRMRRRCK
jgi:hypothetical protein